MFVLKVVNICCDYAVRYNDELIQTCDAIPSKLPSLCASL